MAELTQLVNSLKVQYTAEMTDLKLAHANQIEQLREKKNSSADRFPPQGGQTLSGTDPIQFVSHKYYNMHPISMPKFNIQEMRGSLENFEVLCRINNTRILSEIFLVWCRRYLGKLLMVSGRCAHRMTNSAIRSSKVCHSMVPLSTTL